eukprot:TRINITY_DN23290_c0_g2_i1.p1 TRINITY_DN23290_c0_g2~~TRINITY_DN23290_c0_g2_i1.p1  ORF type:complete len:707 (-),score=173.02 TRINITY_DN23290_c0_g2_i1:161-2281(-)
MVPQELNQQDASHPKKMSRKARKLERQSKAPDVAVHGSTPCAVDAASDAHTAKVIQKKKKVRAGGGANKLTKNGGDLNQNTEKEPTLVETAVAEASRPRKRAAAKRASEVLAASTAAPSVEETAAEEAPPSLRRGKRRRVAKAIGEAATAAVGSDAALEAVRKEGDEPITSFEDVASDLGRPLLKELKSREYHVPTPVQARSLPLALAGRDIVAVAATGSGKTCAYLLPAIAHVNARARQRPRSPERSASSAAAGVVAAAPSGGTGRGPPPGAWTCTECGNVNWPQRTTCNTRTCRAARPDVAEPGVANAGSSSSSSAPAQTVRRPAAPAVLVLVPTRELAQQIHKETCKFAAVGGARALCIYGGVPKGEQAEALLSQGADIVIATPGRCLDFLEIDRFLGQPLCVSNVSYLVLDEADRMLEAGFFPAIFRVIEKCPASNDGKAANVSGAALRRQTMFFTATWPASVEEAARRVVVSSAAQVRIEQRELGKLTANKSVTQRVHAMTYHKEKMEQLQEVLKKDLEGGTCMIFCKTQKRCDWLAKKIQGQHPFAWIRAIHAGKDQHEREDTLSLFRDLAAKGARQKGVLVATNVAARGIDVPGVRLVVVYDFSSIEDYVHQIGRTGRAGARGEAVTFYVKGDGGARELADVLQQAEQVVPPALLELADAEAQPQEGAGADAEEDISSQVTRARQGWKDSVWAKQRDRQ